MQRLYCVILLERVEYNDLVVRTHDEMKDDDLRSSGGGGGGGDDPVVVRLGPSYLVRTRMSLPNCTRP
jgi:hypothetical protein